MNEKTAIDVEWTEIQPQNLALVKKPTMKNITVIPATGGQHLDLAIQPGTTMRDIKSQLNLGSDFVLTRGRGSEPIQDDANVYELVPNGAKLYATTDVEWGKSQ